MVHDSDLIRFVANNAAHCARSKSCIGNNNILLCVHHHKLSVDDVLHGDINFKIMKFCDNFVNYKIIMQPVFSINSLLFAINVFVFPFTSTASLRGQNFVILSTLHSIVYFVYEFVINNNNNVGRYLKKKLIWVECGVYRRPTWRVQARSAAAMHLLVDIKRVFWFQSACWATRCIT
jgi:hypothetical protein